MFSKEIVINNKKIIIETGELAKQSNGAVLVKLGETTVLVTVVLQKNGKSDKPENVLPLSVDYRERTYAHGKIPGGFFKREGRPKETEIHIARMIDRSIRPLFPKGFNVPIQITALVLSFDGENDTDVPSIIGASTALMVSDIPFDKPVGCLRVGYLNNKFIINPTNEERQKSNLDLILVGTGTEVIMIELKANQVDEQIVIDAINYASNDLKKIVQSQIEFKNEVNNNKIILEEKKVNSDLVKLIQQLVSGKIIDIAKIQDKNIKERTYEELKTNILNNPEISKYLTTDITSTESNENKVTESDVINVIEDLFRSEIRDYIIKNQVRLDNRKLDELRPISCSVNILPRTHGSALFVRGQTQSLVTVTLGTPRDMQIIEELEGEYKERFIFHYNFPGFATGDIKPDRAPSRREIGHGLLAKRSIYQLLPDEDSFPYTIRVVSDILESNGSSSMASVCGASLALFDAGVPIKSAVAGVAMGMIKEKEKYVILTDISGLEDHIGDFDFKIAGTRTGITAIQLDVKILEVDISIISDVFKQAKLARQQILNKMDSVINKPREELSGYAPRLMVLKISQEKIGDLIGPGGKNIRQILEQTGTEIDIEEDGKIFISGKDSQSLKLAQKMVEDLTADIVIGKTYQGKVVKIADFGAFIEVLPGKEGLVHISQLADYRVNHVRDVVKEGDEVLVKVIDIDDKGRLVLSRKAALDEFKK